ncbi:MAG TPA: DUF6544 family protein [Solirubrobacterales bacterium]|nr:DUF6544 family protein [Solirubrobacterales bacterium]
MSERRPPPRLADHLARVLPARAETPRRVRLTQRGEMIRRPGEKPLAFTATQEYAVDEVGFEWRASFGPNRLVRLIVVDRYRKGEGSLAARVWGLIPVTRSSGPETDRAEATRYLAELPWVPHAIASNPELSWRQLEDGSVEVSTEAGGRLASVVLALDDSGLISTVSGMRPRLAGKTAIETPFSGSFGDYVELGGVRAPGGAEVSWELPEGRFTYWRGEVTSLEVE